MSKSLGNTYRVIDLIEKGFSPLDYRFLVLGAHYKTRMNFTFEALQGAKQGRKSILHAYWEVIDEEKEDVSAHPLLTAFKEALADNLNSPKALAVVHEATEETGSIRKSLLEEMDSIISILEPLPTIPKEIQELVEKREAARNNKEFMQSDAFREEIETLGWVVDDTPNGPRVTPL